MDMDQDEIIDKENLDLEKEPELNQTTEVIEEEDYDDQRGQGNQSGSAMKVPLVTLFLGGSGRDGQASGSQGQPSVEGEGGKALSTSVKGRSKPHLIRVGHRTPRVFPYFVEQVRKQLEKVDRLLELNEKERERLIDLRTDILEKMELIEDVKKGLANELGLGSGDVDVGCNGAGLGDEGSERGPDSLAGAAMDGSIGVLPPPPPPPEVMLRETLYEWSPPDHASNGMDGPQ